VPFSDKDALWKDPGANSVDKHSDSRQTTSTRLSKSSPVDTPEPRGSSSIRAISCPNWAPEPGPILRTGTCRCAPILPSCGCDRETPRDACTVPGSLIGLRSRNNATKLLARNFVASLSRLRQPVEGHHHHPLARLQFRRRPRAWVCEKVSVSAGAREWVCRKRRARLSIERKQVYSEND
jgi:hypothetical protein